ncbi:MAG: sulfotransferase [Patescibacteria group bacterium]
MTLIPQGKTLPIKSWNDFMRRVKPKGCVLLRRLDEFPQSILVTGCQRSGTTMLSRIITQSEGMTNYWFGKDDELDAALILAGYVEHTPKGRYCFQTTYLNECYCEYFEHFNGHKIIWILRNPFSVIYSMLYNWRRRALNDLFKGCGARYLEGFARWKYEHLGFWGVSRLLRACLAYNGKTCQVFELRQRLRKSQLLVIEYDSLVKQKLRVLPKVYEFIELPYKEEYAGKISAKSLEKSRQLSHRARAMITELCKPVYEKAKTLLSDL